MFLGSYRFRRIVRREGYEVLCDNVPTITLLIDPVYGHARLLLMRSPHCLMNMVSIHAFATKLGQQRWMDVDDGMGKSLNKKRRNHQQETRQDNELHAVLRRVA